MKKMVIVNGTWAKKSDGTFSGNLTGYTTIGEKVHIYGRQLEGMGIKAGDKIAQPLYVVAKEDEIVPRNADGSINNDENAVKVLRLTAKSVFGSVLEMAKAFAEAATVEAQVQTEIKKAYTSAGFSDEDIKALGGLVLA